MTRRPGPPIGPRGKPGRPPGPRPDPQAVPVRLLVARVQYHVAKLESWVDELVQDPAPWRKRLFWEQWRWLRANFEKLAEALAEREGGNERTEERGPAG